MDLNQELIIMLEVIMSGSKRYCGDHYIYAPQLNADSINEIHAELVASQHINAASNEVECWYCHKKSGKGHKCSTCGREGR